MTVIHRALYRPHTFIVMALLIVILGIVTRVGAPTDVFPVISFLVATVLWNCAGASLDDMEKRIVPISIRHRERRRGLKDLFHG